MIYPTATTSDFRPLYVSDLDGTLLGSDSRVSARSAELLRDLTDQGVMITAATARTPATVDTLLRGTGLRLPVIVMTGAALWHPTEHRYLSQRFFEGPTAEAVRLLMERHGLRPFVYNIDSSGMLHTYHNGEMTRREQAFADERTNLPLKQMHINHPDGLKPLPQTILFFAVGERARVMECADDLRARVAGCSVSAYNDIFNPKMGFLEVFAAGVSKAAAVKSLAEGLGATSVTVFGDNLNDIPMMQVADRAIAVANAAPEVKAIAHEIIGPNTADSVARYIRSSVDANYCLRK